MRTDATMVPAVPSFVIIGGGGAGLFYARQLLRAAEAGRLLTDQIFVVDHDPRCPASAAVDPRLRLEVGDWSAWLDERLESLGPKAHLVPYHWAPHLLVDWLARQAERAGGRVSRGGAIPPRGVPLERPTTAGDRALSYATWACPPTCIEPTLCPHTRGPRDWSLACDLDAGLPADPFDDRIVFRCLHLVYGVGTIPVEDILGARDRVAKGLEMGPRAYLVATSSHCHALATRLEVEPRALSV